MNELGLNGEYPDSYFRDVSCASDRAAATLPHKARLTGARRRRSYRNRLPESCDQESSGLLAMESSAFYDSPYLNPLYDFAFKYIFGKEAHKDLLIDFLNSLFEGRKVIRDLLFCSTEQLGEDPGNRTVIYDLLCTGDQGERFLVEMQRSRQDFFGNRALYYVSRLISQQVPAGKAGDDFRVDEVYLIALLDFCLWDHPELMNDPVKRYMRTVDMSWVDTRERFSGLELIFIQLPAFRKTWEILETRLDHWLYALKHLGQMREQPGFLGGAVFEKLFQVAKVTKLNKEDQRMYKLVIDTDRDWRNALSYAEKKGLAKGLAKSEKRAKAIAKEMAKETAREVKLNIVQGLIRETGLDDRKIAVVAGVEENFVKMIREKRTVHTK